MGPETEVMKNSQSMWRLLGAAVSFALLAPSARAEKLDLDVSVANPVVLADQKTTTYVKVGLTGFALPEEDARPPVNVAIVLDKSGSMNGEKIERAREAAKQAVSRLGPQDIVSIVTYDTNVQVLTPATKVSDIEAIHAAINRIGASGSTALFAGVSKGAAELRKFLERERVNRVVLLSDGIANVGPSSPQELGELGGALSEEGMAVSTIGLGLDYNEDLMTRLAKSSDGNHYFVESPSDLPRIFDQEFGDTMSVVAQEITVTIRCQPGVRPVRTLGRDADISGQEVRAAIQQVYSERQQYVLLEVEIPAGAVGTSRVVADVDVQYANMISHSAERLAGGVSVRYSDSESEVSDSVDSDVMVASVMQIAVINNDKAIWLRDQGRIEEARALLIQNGDYLGDNFARFKAVALDNYAKENRFSSENLSDAQWLELRKRNAYNNNAILQNQPSDFSIGDKKE